MQKFLNELTPFHLQDTILWYHAGGSPFIFSFIKSLHFVCFLSYTSMKCSNSAFCSPKMQFSVKTHFVLKQLSAMQLSLSNTYSLLSCQCQLFLCSTKMKYIKSSKFINSYYDYNLHLQCFIFTDPLTTKVNGAP